MCAFPLSPVDRDELKNASGADEHSGRVGAAAVPASVFVVDVSAVSTTSDTVPTGPFPTVPVHVSIGDWLS
jgi:hypothetical protein